MSYRVLSRKWRPKKYSQIVGQDHIVQTLINSIKLQRISHAYLFTGPRGVGKTTAARVLSKSSPINIFLNKIQALHSLNIKIHFIT